MRQGLISILSVTIVAGGASAAQAACPPSCPLSLGLESIWKVGGLEQDIFTSVEIPLSFLTVGGSGSVEVRLAQPFLTSDPGWGSPEASLILRFEPIEAWTPARFDYIVPLNRIDRFHLEDPESPSVRIFPPVPIPYAYLPRPFVEVPARGRLDVSFGLQTEVRFSPAPAFTKAVFTYRFLPTVPEPASWALMICGFGLAGAALRGRRAAPAA